MMISDYDDGDCGYGEDGVDGDDDCGDGVVMAKWMMVMHSYPEGEGWARSARMCAQQP